MLVAVPSLEQAKQRWIEPIKTLGYTYMPEYVSWLPGELFFRKGPPGPWTHHMHVMELSCPRWEALLVFRDYLRAHPEAAQAYADIKRDLAASSVDNMAAYRNGKTVSSRRPLPRRAPGACMQAARRWRLVRIRGNLAAPTW